MPMPEWLRVRRSKTEESRDAALWSKCPKCSEVLYRRDLAAIQPRLDGGTRDAEQARENGRTNRRPDGAFDELPSLDDVLAEIIGNLALESPHPDKRRKCFCQLALRRHAQSLAHKVTELPCCVKLFT